MAVQVATISIDQLIESYLGDHHRYCVEALKIRTKLGRMMPLTMNRAQDIIHAVLSEQRRKTGKVRAIILKARQEGVSTYVGSRNYRGITLRGHRRAVVIADKKERAGDLFGIYERFDRNIPPALKPAKRASALKKHLVYNTPDGNQGLDSEVVVETAGDVNAGRAATIHYLHASELAFWPKAEDTWISLMQAVPDEDSEVIVESTANSVGGLFHELWVQAINGESEFIPIFLPWFVHDEYRTEIGSNERWQIENSADPYERRAQDTGFSFMGEHVRLNPEQLAWRRRTIATKLRGDTRAWKQEYPSTPEEAFLVSGGAFFDEEKLSSYRDSSRPPLIRGDLQIRKGGIILIPSQRGFLKVWKFPTRDGRYVIFADTAEGRMVSARAATFSDPEQERGGRDFSSAHVFEVETKAYVACLHGRMAPEVFAEHLWNLGYWYLSKGRPDQGTTVRNPAYLGVEREKSGHTVLHILQKEYRYPNLHYQRQINRRTRKVTSILGWTTNAETRGPLLDDFAAVIRNESIELPDLDTIRELLTFVIGDDGKPEAMEGTHDDRVISAAGCIQMAQFAPAPLTEMPSPEPVAASPTGWDDYGYLGRNEVDPQMNLEPDPDDPFALRAPWEQ
jgi:hypothetical protein